MRLSRWLVLFVAVSMAFTAWSKPKEPKKPKTPELDVVEIRASRTSEYVVEVDGKVRNCGERTLSDVVLGFEMLAPGGEVVTKQSGSLEDAELKPGEESEFHWRMRDPARAVSFRVIAKDRKYELVVAHEGPHPIE